MENQNTVPCQSSGNVQAINRQILRQNLGNVRQNLGKVQARGQFFLLPPTNSDSLSLSFSHGRYS